MDIWIKLTLWTVLVFSAGAQEAQRPSVIYPFTETCAVRGSTVTLPCSFTPRESFRKDRREIQLRIVRVRWCQNHPICHGSTPSVFDSNSTNNDPRYRYLGDMKGNCTLQIRDVQWEDDSTFRFRMEADDHVGDFTNTTGVTVSVVGWIPPRIKASSNEFRRGQSVSLQCTSLFCTFHHLNVTWFRDGHALPESGHALQLGPLTAGDSGNYTCVLSMDARIWSDPFSLQVEDGDGDGDGDGADGGNHLVLIVLIVRLLVFGLITLIVVAVASVVIWRTCRCHGSSREN